MAHLKGHVEKGVIVLDDASHLPEGTLVEFVQVKPPTGRHHPDVERYAGIIPRSEGERDAYYRHLRKKHA